MDTVQQNTSRVNTWLSRPLTLDTFGPTTNTAFCLSLSPLCNTARRRGVAENKIHNQNRNRHTEMMVFNKNSEFIVLMAIPGLIESTDFFMDGICHKNSSYYLAKQQGNQAGNIS